MQFLTIRETKEGWHEIRRLGGRRFYGPFRFRVALDPRVESFAVEAETVPNAMNFWAVREFLPDIAAGVADGVDFSIRYGTRYCCIRLTVLDQKYHDVDTHSEGMRKEGSEFVTMTCDHYATALDPLRPDWLTSDVVALARGIDADKATDRFPILSDALRDAGCEDQLVHDHLQLCPDHGSSCWVV
ncbi:MAG: hypothetical protein K2V38_05780, partial [Gemmataceae bacterium]|nr:hypothetical protein [Gemmataceae bacterium]